MASDHFHPGSKTIRATLKSLTPATFISPWSNVLVSSAEVSRFFFCMPSAIKKGPPFTCRVLSETTLSCPGPSRVAKTPDLLLLGSKPELLQQAQIIVCFPLLDYLAVLEAVDGDAFERYLPLSGRAKLLCLSLMGAAYGVAAYHLLTLGYQIFDADVEVGEGSKERGDKLLGLLVALDVLIGFVPDEVGRVELFYEVWVSLVHDLPSTTCQVLVLLCRHSALPPTLCEVAGCATGSLRPKRPYI